MKINVYEEGFGVKRKMLIIYGIIFCFSMTGCQSDKYVQVKELITKEQENHTDKGKVIEESKNNIAEVKMDDIKTNTKIDVTFKDMSRVVKDENGDLILTVTGNLPVVNIEGNPEATNNINVFYEKAKKNEEEMINQYIQYASDNYKIIDGEQLKYWHGYELGTTYTTARVDSSVISIISELFEYAGGAHPNIYRTAQNFDTQTGELLTLNDILTDVSKATEYINNYLLKLMKEQEDTIGYFEDYESYVGDILTNSTWYLSNEGFVVICNEYIVSPHAAGIQEYVIPYEKFPYLVEKYQYNE